MPASLSSVGLLNLDNCHAGARKEAIINRGVSVELPKLPVHSMEGTSHKSNIFYIKQLVQGKRNVALYQDASQSSTVVYKGLGVASSAVDGNTDPYFKIGSVTATEDGECNPWWMVKLDKNYTIHSVELYNRLDSCCSERLANFTVE
eukprot:scaffold11361_cov626-Chaetoceros_neogracile.AAC.1